MNGMWFVVRWMDECGFNVMNGMCERNKRVMVMSVDELIECW